MATPFPPSAALLRSFLSQVYHSRAQRHYDNVNIGLARKDLILAVENDPANAAASYLLAQIYFTNLDAPDKANKLLEVVCKSPDATREQLLMHFTCNLRLTKPEYDQSAEIYQRLDQATSPTQERASFRARLRPQLLTLSRQFEYKKDRPRAKQWFYLWRDSYPTPHKEDVLKACQAFYLRNEMAKEYEEVARTLRDIEKLRKLRATIAARAAAARKTAPGPDDELVRAMNGYIALSDAVKAKELAKQAGKHLLLFFYSRDSASAQHFQRYLANSTSFTDGLGKRFVVLLVDLDDPFGARIGENYKITRAPGYVVAKHEGDFIATIRHQATQQAFLRALYNHPDVAKALKDQGFKKIVGLLGNEPNMA